MEMAATTARNSRKQINPVRFMVYQIVKATCA
jgi:hypothetical protein